MVAVQDQFLYNYPGGLPSAEWQLHTNGTRPKMIDYRVVGADASGSYFARKTTSLASPDMRVGLWWWGNSFGGRAGLVARCPADINAALAEFYYLEFNDTYLRLWRRKNAGVDATLEPAVDTALTGQIAVTIVRDDVVELDVAAGVIRGLLNGVAVASYTDPTPIAAGDFAGMHFSNQGRARRFFATSGTSTIGPWLNDQFHVLTEDFNTQSTTRWTWTGTATVDLTATEAVVPAAADYSAGFVSTEDRSLVDSSIYFAFQGWPSLQHTAGVASTEAGMSLTRHGTTDELMVFRDGAGVLHLRLNGVDQATLVWDEVRHHYIRFREAAGTTYVETSRTGANIDWQAWTSIPNPVFGMGALRVSGWAGFYGSITGPGALRVGGVNIVDPAEIPPNAVVFDSFNRPDSTNIGTADTGQAWVGTEKGEYEIVGGLLKQNSASSAFAHIQTGITEQDVSAYMMNAPVAGHWWGFMANTTGEGATDGYRIVVDPAGKVSLSKNVAGVSTGAVDSLPNGTAQAGDIYRLVTTTVAARAYRNGTQFAEMPADNALAAYTYAAIRHGEYQGSGEPLRWDDFTVYNAAGTDPDPDLGFAVSFWLGDGVKRSGYLRLF